MTQKVDKKDYVIVLYIEEIGTYERAIMGRVGRKHMEDSLDKKMAVAENVIHML